MGGCAKVLNIGSNVIGWIIHPSVRGSVMDVRRVALLGVLGGLCVGVQVVPRPPNVEFTSFVVFLVGFFFGVRFAVFLGSLVMFVNGFVSPWGFAGLVMPFQVVGMAVVGFAGGVFRRYFKAGSNFSRLNYVEVSVLAAFVTLVYDVVTNFGFAIMFNVDFLVALIMGVWFSIIHVVSNAMLFGFAFPPLIRLSLKYFGGLLG